MAAPDATAPAARCVAPHLATLRACGFCRLAPRAGRAQRALHAAYRALALAATALYLLQECAYAYQERGDMEKVSRVMFLLLCHVTSIAKQLVFWIDAERIDALLAGLNAPELQRGDGERAAVLRRTAVSAARLQRAYAGTAVCTCSLWLLLTAAEYSRTHRADFPFWLPTSPDRPVEFFFAVVYSYYVTTLVGIANTTMDAFIGTLLQQLTAQLRIVRWDIQALPQRARAAPRPYARALHHMLRDCLAHYNMICSLAATVEQVFGGAILVQFGVGGWILCMAAYKVVDLHVLSVEFASMMLFIVCILVELFLYCYFGNELTFESARVQEALYGCGWERRGARPLARALLVARERAQRPLRAAAGGLVPLSLQTFLKILKSSYSFYAVLRQTK